MNRRINRIVDCIVVLMSGLIFGSIWVWVFWDILGLISGTVIFLTFAIIGIASADESIIIRDSVK